MLRFSHWTAFVVGIVLPILETYRRWDNLLDWPSWLDDYIAAGLLLYAWRAGQGSLVYSRPYLMAAWGYTTGMAYMAFFGHLQRAETVDVSGFSTEFVLQFQAFGLGLAVFGLIGAWRGGRPAAATSGTNS